MYSLIALTHPRAGKEYVCIWCGNIIKASEIHCHEKSKYNKLFQDHRWHPECYDDAMEYCRYNDEFTPYINPRPEN